MQQGCRQVGLAVEKGSYSEANSGVDQAWPRFADEAPTEADARARRRQRHDEVIARRTKAKIDSDAERAMVAWQQTRAAPPARRSRQRGIQGEPGDATFRGRR
jgi:hypothetical protein